MTRFLSAVSLLLMTASALTATGGLMVSSAMAQGAGPHEHDACARDVSRFCRAHMNEGDSVVLACLKQNRERLSKGCAKVLTDHGQ
jgi:Cysteine rich repeat